MSKRAFILGGNGQIGIAVASRLSAEGWSIVLGSRQSSHLPPELRGKEIVTIALDRNVPGALRKAVSAGADLLVDTIGYDERDAQQLLEIQELVAQVVSISSASVYRDESGRTLDEARSHGFPELPVPITEAQPTVAPGPDTYSTRKVAMERMLLDHAHIPVAVLRPCAIHGPYSRHPREWWFVKRHLDGRQLIPIAYSGESRFHTTATANLAALISAIAARPATGIFNAVDPDAPSVLEIGEAVLAAVGSSARLVPNVDGAYPPRIGATPWSIPRPFVLADAASRAIGYKPVGGYRETVEGTCHWLMQASTVDWQEAFPVLASYPVDLFDYAAEDSWFAKQGGAV